MMMIGQQERVVVVGPTEAHHCLRCQTETDFAPQLPLRHRFGLLLMLLVVAGLAVAGWMWRSGAGAG